MTAPKEKQDGLPIGVWLPVMSTLILGALLMLGWDTFAS